MAGLRDQVIGLINEANLSDSPEEKLVQVQEIMLKREPPLLPEFIDNVLDFQVSRRITGRRFTAQFAEAVIKQRPQEFLAVRGVRAQPAQREPGRAQVRDPRGRPARRSLLNNRPA